MKTAINICLIFFILITFYGCGLNVMSRFNAITHKDQKSSIESYQEKAQEFEKNNEWQEALENWRIADALMAQKISLLADRVGGTAEIHYQKGLNYQKDGYPDKAMVEFITTLRYDRNHRGALRSLRASESQYRTIVYAVREGDTFKSIAGQIYRNIDYDYIVKFFSNLSSEKELVPGLVLTLPNIEIDFTLRFFNYSKEITLARKYYRDKEFRKLLPCAENILNHVPDSDEAVFLINMAYYGISDQYLNGEDYKAAIETLKKVDPKFKNVKRRIAYIESLHTKRISDAEKKNNTENYQKGKLLYSRGQYVKALSVLEKVTPGFLNVQKVISDLKSQMKKESEIHYRKGVKHYLKEELSEAIDEWRVASQLDPENAKIKNDIDNAGQLLKKINKIK